MYTNHIMYWSQGAVKQVFDMHSFISLQQDDCLTALLIKITYAISIRWYSLQ